MRLEKYCNEIAQHEVANGFNLEGQPTFETAVSIACRKEQSDRIIRSVAGADISAREIRATSRYFTVVTVTEGDLLDGQKVLRASQYKGRTGTIEGYEVYV